MLARTVTILVDVPYVWEFHQMPSESRFHLVLEGSPNGIEAFRFAAVAWENSS